MPAAGQYSLVGALEHESTGTMGRLSLIGAGYRRDGEATASWTCVASRHPSRISLELAVRPISPSVTETRISAIGTPIPTAILADWTASAGPDVFLAFSPPGKFKI